MLRNTDCKQRGAVMKTPLPAHRFAALLLWGILLLCGRLAGAQIISASVTPNALTAAGGNVTVQAILAGGFQVSSIAVQENNGYIGAMTLSVTNPDGTKTYTLTRAVPANVTNSPKLYTYTFTATSTTNQTATGTAGIVDVAAPNAIQIVSSAISTNALTAAGGSLTVTAKIRIGSPNAISSIYAYANGSGLGSLNYVAPNNADGTQNYSGTFTIAKNVSNAPKPLLITITATDSASNKSPAVAGTLTQGTVTPISIGAVSLSTNTLPADGGNVNISATINAPAPNGISQVYAFYENGGGIGTLNAGAPNADGSVPFSNSFTIPKNTTSVPRVQRVIIRAYDSVNNYTYKSVGLLTVAGSTPLSIVSGALSASTLPASGGSLTVTAKVLAPSPNTVSQVYAQGTNGISLGLLNYVAPDNADGSKNYTGTFTITPNASNSARLSLVTLRAIDSTGNPYVFLPIGMLTTAAASPLSVVSTSLSTNALPASGGSLIVKATLSATAPNDISDVYALDSSGSVIGSGALAFTSANGNGTKNYTGSFTVPANTSYNAPRVYTLQLRVRDTAGAGTVFAPLGTLTVAAPTPIAILGTTLSTNTLPQTGGNLTITAKVFAPAPNAISQVYATSVNGGISFGALTYVGPDNADGSQNFTGSFAVSANSVTAARKNAIVVYAYDPFGNYAYANAGILATGSGAVGTPITITASSISATTVPANGGDVIVKATVSVTAPNTVSTLNVYRNNGGIGSLTYQSTNADGTKNYSGSFAIAASGGAAANYARTSPLLLSATDSGNNTAFATLGTLTQAALTPVSVVSKSLSATSFPASGGQIQIAATLNLPSPNTLSTLYVYGNDGGIGSLTYQNTNADGTKNYAGAFAVPVNNSNNARVQNFTLLVRDAAGNGFYTSLGTVTTAAASPIMLGAATLSAISFTAAGGRIIVNAKANAPSPNSVGSVQLFANGSSVASLTYLYPDADGTGNYIGSYQVPANTQTNTSRTDYYTLQAYDSLSNYVYAPLPSVTVGGNTPLSIVSAAITPNSLLAPGGDVLVNAVVKATPTNDVASVNVYRNLGYSANLTYQSTNADGTKNFSGTLPVPANINDLSRTDFLALIATDSIGNTAETVLNTLTTAPVTPISITSANVSSTSLSANGGDLIVNATVSAPAPNSVSYIYVYSNGSGLGSLVYQNTNADGTFNYSGSFVIPANAGAIPQPYLITLTAADSAGNTATASLGAVTVSQVPGTVAGKITLESLVSTAPSQTITFDFRPTDGSADFMRTASVSPSGFFSFPDIPRQNYSLWIKGPKNLAKVVPVNTLNSDAHNVAAFLPGGDANNDNVVDIADFGALVNAYNSDSTIPKSGYDIHADFNGDGLVDIADFGILVNNYNAVGDP